jgi:hypothetical protein
MSMMTMVRRGFGAALLAPALVFAFAAPAGAQSLLDDLLPQPAGVCTCAVMRPPNDCGAILGEPTSIARQQRGEIRAQCAMDWREGCEEQYGWQACSTIEAREQLNQQCDALAERWWSEVAQPQIGQIRAQCNAANADWIEQCETVERPQNCATCEDMTADIARLLTQISDSRGWIESMRGGGAVLTPDDETEISERLEQIRRWERELADKQSGYAMLQDSEFCPRS